MEVNSLCIGEKRLAFFTLTAVLLLIFNAILARFYPVSIILFIDMFYLVCFPLALATKD